MTKALVHGNPETAAIWRALTNALAERGVDDIVTLSPPGFGAPVPPGWSATPAEYVDWLAGEISALEGPVDLVGHDWGAGHVFGLIAEHGEIVRSWACDVGGLLHPDYVWHDMARVWQTPGAGEEAVAAMIGVPVVDRAAAYVDLGIVDEIATELAAAADATMAECILGLYRGAAQPALRHLGDRLANAARPPGLLLNPSDDAYVGADLTPKVAARLGADVVELSGQGHWWMITGPEAAADALVAFWSNL